MKCGKSHKILPKLEPIHEAINIALLLAQENCQDSRKDVAVDIRIAIERIQYELDKFALPYAKEDE